MATKKAAKAARKFRTTQAPARKAKPAAKKRAAAKRPAKPAQTGERLGLIEVGGKPATVLGADVVVGQRAPDFAAQVGVWPGRDLWQELAPLAETAGQVRILAAVPSLDTSTCSLETRRFNQEAASLASDIVIITVSTDLPPAQKRWCGAEGVDRVRVVSDHMAAELDRKSTRLNSSQRRRGRACRSERAIAWTMVTGR